LILKGGGTPHPTLTKGKIFFAFLDVSDHGNGMTFNLK